MKKTFILTLVALFAAISVFASDDLLILESGSPDFWKEAGKLMTIDIDWSKATVVEWGNKNEVKEDFGTIEQYNKMKGEDYVRDWPDVKQSVLIGASSMTNMFSKKGIKMITPQSPGYEQLSDEQKAELKKQQAKMEKNKMNPVLYRDYSEASYDMLLIVDSIDMGNAGASAFSGLAGDALYRGGAELVGTIEVRDHQTNELVCKMHANHLKGRGNFSETSRITNLFWRLAEDAMPKLLKSLSKQANK